MTAATVGLLLAAGEGRRFGGPKGLAADADGVAWVQRTARRLHEGGCEQVYVVVGASADQVASLVDSRDEVVVAEDWAEGMSASLRAGLGAVGRVGPPVSAAVVMLVDLPGVGPDVIQRLAARADPAVLARAAYGGEAGHPVLLGRDHWEPIIASARGDRGARDYLAQHEPVLVECGDIGSPEDVDHR